MDDGHKLLEEYETSLLNYWEDGHGDIVVSVSELQGFLDCLITLKLIQQEEYMCTIDCFREKAKKIRRF